MKLITYNILNGGEDRLESIIKVISGEKPDFLIINEANEFEKDDKLNKFSEKIGLPHFKLSLSGEYNYHAVLFSKYPFKEVKEIKPLRNAGVLVVVDTKLGKICIAGAHLSPYTEESRLPEIDLIIDEQKQYPNKVLIGDMNSLSAGDGYDEEVIKGFNETQLSKFTTNGKFRFDVINRITASGYLDSALIFKKQKTPTVPTGLKEDEAHLTDIRVDYIFVSESLKDKIKSYSVVRNKITEKASDHYPVTIELN